MKKYSRSAKNPKELIELSTETKMADMIYLDPTSSTYRKKLRSLTKAGYEVVEDFNPRYLKTQKGVYTEEGKGIRKVYHGSIKLKRK